MLNQRSSTHPVALAAFAVGLAVPTLVSAAPTTIATILKDLEATEQGGRYTFYRSGLANARDHIGTAVGSSYPGSFPKARQTTEREKLIASLRSYGQLEADWDGEGAEAPNIASIRLASNFACMLSEKFESPEPMLHASGRAGLMWEHDNFYGELEFYADGQAAYYFQIGEDRHKGKASVNGERIPPFIEVLIPIA